MPALLAAPEALDRCHAIMRLKQAQRHDPYILIETEAKFAAFAAAIVVDGNAVVAAISQASFSDPVEERLNRFEIIQPQSDWRRQIDIGEATPRCHHDPNCTDRE